MTIPRSHQMSGQHLIKTDGCYAGVFDALSPVNVTGRLSSFMQAADQEATTAREQWATLTYFNDRWVKATRCGLI